MELDKPLQIWCPSCWKKNSQQCSQRTDGVCQAEELTHVVPGGLGPHRVFSSKSNTAHSNDQKNAHLKVPQGHNIVTQPAKPIHTHAHTGLNIRYDCVM